MAAAAAANNRNQILLLYKQRFKLVSWVTGKLAGLCFVWHCFVWEQSCCNLLGRELLGFQQSGHQTKNPFTTLSTYIEYIDEHKDSN